MTALNWKDRDLGRVSKDGYYLASEAHASREVGGYYQILCIPGGDGLRANMWDGSIRETGYSVEYRRRVRFEWGEIDYPRGEAGTLAEAKRMAEEDHECRRCDVT